MPSFFLLPLRSHQLLVVRAEKRKLTSVCIRTYTEQVGLTPKEVRRLAKRRPDVINSIGGEHVRRLVDFFLEDLKVGKVIHTHFLISRRDGGEGGYGLR